MAADVLAIADAEGIARFHLVGHSMGGVIAQHVALTAPAESRQLALLCTFLKGRQGTMIAPAMLPTAIRSRIGTRGMRRRAFVELVMPPAYLATSTAIELCDGARLLSSVATSPISRRSSCSSSGRWGASTSQRVFASLAPIPTLVVSAAHDRIARPAYGRALAAAIPGSRFVEFREAGHAVTIQCAEVNALLLEHFEGSRSVARP